MPHFWRVETKPGPRVVIHRLTSDTYVETQTVTAGETATVEEPFPLTPLPADLLG